MTEIATKLFSSYGGNSASAIKDSLDKIGSGEYLFQRLHGNEHVLTNRWEDYIDLYLIHDPMAGPKKRLQLWKALIDAKKEGKVRTIGVSN